MLENGLNTTCKCETFINKSKLLEFCSDWVEVAKFNKESKRHFKNVPDGLYYYSLCSNCKSVLKFYTKESFV
jgi:hypothetical protein